MSQEEEKLIEEWQEYCSCRPNIDVKSVRKAEDKISEAFRSGKLAGFEVCEKLGIQIEGLRVEDGFLWIKIPYQKFGESGLSFSIITSSLIEEEKNKL